MNRYHDLTDYRLNTLWPERFRWQIQWDRRQTPPIAWTYGLLGFGQTELAIHVENGPELAIYILNLLGAWTATHPEKIGSGDRVRICVMPPGATMLLQAAPTEIDRLRLGILMLTPIKEPNLGEKQV